MAPSYRDGDYLLSVTPKLSRIRNGDIIIFEHPVLGHLVKEICHTSNKGYFVQGRHPMSTDSQSIGMVLPKMIKGKVIAKIPVKSDRS
jgi:phage repressor protein C with HTH and peptisase S24 domain